MQTNVPDFSNAKILKAPFILSFYIDDVDIDRYASLVVESSVTF